MFYDETLADAQLSHVVWKKLAATAKRERNLRLARGVGLLGICVVGLVKHDTVVNTLEEVPVIGADFSTSLPLYSSTGLAGFLGGIEFVGAGIAEYNRRNDKRVMVATAEVGKTICEITREETPEWVSSTLPDVEA